MYESLHSGVDYLSETRHYPSTAPTAYRSKAKKLVSIPIMDDLSNPTKSYRLQYIGRDRQKFKDKLKIRNMYKEKTVYTYQKYTPALRYKPIGFRPMLKNEYDRNAAKKRSTMGYFRTNKDHLDCQQTIAETFLKWVKAGAIQYVGSFSDLRDSPKLDLVNTILPISVERNKPRVCQDGGACKCVSPFKIDCKMDLLTDVLKVIEKDMWLNKFDDSNGFHHIKLNEWSRAMFGLKFGDNVYRAVAMPFGATQRLI